MGGWGKAGELIQLFRVASPNCLCTEQDPYTWEWLLQFIWGDVGGAMVPFSHSHWFSLASPGRPCHGAVESAGKLFLPEQRKVGQAACTRPAAQHRLPRLCLWEHGEAARLPPVLPRSCRAGGRKVVQRRLEHVPANAKSPESPSLPSDRANST